MAKTFCCLYHGDEQLDHFIKESFLEDVPNLLVQIFSENECRQLELREVLKRKFSAATILGCIPSGSKIERKVEEEIFLSFTLLDEKIFKLAYYDLETGLPNGLKFSQYLDEILNKVNPHGKKLALLMFDMDRFKNINDSLGHRAGDDILKQIAERMKKNVPAGSFLARFAGDKFTLLLTSKPSVENIGKIAHHILKEISSPLLYQGRELFITASIGASFYPCDGQDDQTLIKNADTALNESKQQGGNKLTYYSPDMKGKVLLRFELENHLRTALQKKELFLCYQPLVDLKTGRVTGNEALLRWNHPHLGLVAPLEFIPLAEEIGVIEEIGAWVIQSACLQTKDWQRKGFGSLGVSVNVSARQFREPGFLQVVIDALKQASLEPEYLTLELTESTMLQNIDHSILTMKELQKLGVKVSIDDFGTGYSSLSYLRSLPINSLKIDKSFISNLQTDSNGFSIVRAIISMGRGLEVEVVAEGVETQEQAELLREMSCQYAQGFFIQKPLQSSDYEKGASEGQLTRYLPLKKG